MKSYQTKETKQLGNRIPCVEVIMVKEVPVSSEIYRSYEEVANSELVEKELKYSDREKFICLHLNSKNRLISYKVVSVGSINMSVVRPREVFKGAILSNAVSIIFLHNHPSGDPTPSEEDIGITERLNKAGNILGIKVLDHIIISRESSFSFSESGLI
jgi:DNA repair protein RadC